MLEFADGNSLSDSIHGPSERKLDILIYLCIYIYLIFFNLDAAEFTEVKFQWIRYGCMKTAIFPKSNELRGMWKDTDTACFNLIFLHSHGGDVETL
jgi:hypothetical protein